ncbi:hypothetical protein C8J57DRAFT_1371544 [Mycena rebaudengoi]|nr:hypothetical protein C8J57DRAFT_1371544 [Mycena rebaudengoi]
MQLLAPLLLSVSLASANSVSVRKPDPCAVIGGQKWVAPKDLRACFESFKVDPKIKTNILDVVSKTLAFHTSVNYQIQAPRPFDKDVHEDLFADIARISRSHYDSDYDLHVDLSKTLKRLNDGHCVWINSCYYSLYLNFLPIPLAYLTEKDGSQNVHIVPEAFQVASAEFPDQISVWQNALPGALKGKLESLSGAKVLLINGRPATDAVDANTLIAGSYQALGTRQNGFFSSYARSTANFAYSMGNFAQQSLPRDDFVELVIQRVNQTKLDKITLPYRARINPATVPFNDSASYRANNCLAVDGTNGIDVYANSFAASAERVDPTEKFQQVPPSPPSARSKKQFKNVILDTAPFTDVTLPPVLQPSGTPVNGSFNGGAFFLQKDGKTGVLALGSFSSDDFDVMISGLLEGLLNLKRMGATQLIVDITNNGGGFICIAHWLHRIIIGPKSTTVPQAGLDTKTRAGPLAQAIVRRIVENNADPANQLLYNPLGWRNASNVFFGATENWLDPAVKVTLNGHKDAFSQRLGQECQPEAFTTPPPDFALFEPSKVAIVGNGRCASSCSLFSITMSKEEGVKTVVVGGRKGVQQEYCGIVGGQSTDFSTIDTEVKSVQLKNNSLAPPDLLVNGVQGITWRLGFGIQNKAEPEEWQDRPADLNLALTPDLVNNPVAIWDAVARKLFK